ncbi:Acylphosphatase-like domain-containing protein [Kockiozyma suomiensis]|uniref:Acylphosphatase-like domain-containing protein n=1 Tax=Kockiozyma suomiensis TaxID=1337062 RepID=UPI0033437C69
MESGVRRIRYEVTGYVQAVGYRRYVEKLAKDIGDITGFACNTVYGSVRGEAQTEFPDALNRFVEGLRVGTEQSKIENVEINNMPALPNETEFTIKKGVF